MKQTVSEQALALVEKKLPKLDGRLTPQDAATATGVTVGEARDALARLMELYITRLTYDNQGNLLFAFELPLRRRGTKTAAEKWAEVKDTVWRVYKRVFRIWIGVMVLLYFAIMVVLMLILIIAQSSGRDDRDRRDKGGDMFGGMLRMLGEGLRIAFWTQALSPGYGYAVDDYGYRHRAVKRKDPNKKSFMVAIYDLALGPDRVEPDPLENEREVAAYLRREKGVLAPAEIVELSGGTIADAEERMADYLVRFNGDPEITEDGVVVGTFESFISGTEAQKADAPIVRYWDEFEAPYEHSGNPSSQNAAIIGMVLFTLFGSFVLLNGGLDTLAYRYGFFGTGLAAFLLGYMPVMFSIAYILTSLFRYGAVKKKELARLERNRHKKVMRFIFEQKLWKTTPEEVYFTLLSRGDKDLTKEQVDAVLNKLVRDLQGDLDLDPQGQPIYNFDRLRREIEAAEHYRTRPAAT